MIEALLATEPADRVRALERALAGAEGASAVEAALPDLLREGDEALLMTIAGGLGRLGSQDVAAARVLETLSRRGGRVRVAALNALRGGATPGAAAASAVAPEEVRPVESGRAVAALPPSRSLAPFDAALAEPTSARLAEAALALVDLAGQRPGDTSREAIEALAGRFAMTALDHAGEVQEGLVRLAKGLRALG